MPSCRSCRHPKRSLIDQRIKSGAALDLISKWTRTEDGAPYLSRNALTRHRMHTIGVPTTPGPKPLNGDFLEAVRDRAWQAVEDGSAMVDVAAGLRAQDLLDRRAEKKADTTLVLVMAAVLGGATIPVGEIEAGAFRELTAGDMGDEA